MLIGFRALQGLGAALISPAALSIISTTFAEGRERARALGVWAAIAIGGSAVGLVLGGFLTQTFSWPWIFFVNVPVGIAGFFFSLRLVPESKDEHAHRSYDVGGAVTVTGGLMALVYAIVRAETHGWRLGPDDRFFVLAGLLLASFVIIELRSAEPLVRLSIFRVRSLLTANVVMFLVASGLFAMFFFNTLYIQKVLGYGPLEAGVAFLPFTAGIMVSAGLASNFATRVGVRPIAAGGMVADHRRHAAPDAAARGRLVRDGRASVAPAHVARNGRGVHAADADRDDRARERGPGARVGALQHLAADRRRARPRDPLDGRGEPDGTRGGSRCRGPRGRLPLGVRGRRDVRRGGARRAGRPPAQAPRRAHRGRGRAGRARDGERSRRRALWPARAGARRRPRGPRPRAARPLRRKPAARARGRSS